MEACAKHLESRLSTRLSSTSGRSNFEVDTSSETIGSLDAQNNIVRSILDSPQSALACLVEHLGLRTMPRNKPRTRCCTPHLFIRPVILHVHFKPRSKPWTCCYTSSKPRMDTSPTIDDVFLASGPRFDLRRPSDIVHLPDCFSGHACIDCPHIQSQKDKHSEDRVEKDLAN